MGRLTTHVLDTVSGEPGAGMAVDLYRVAGEDRVHIAGIRTNDDGRCDGPILDGDAFTTGIYELVFQAGDYFRAAGVAMPDPPFVDQVVVRFGVAEADRHYHVPILVSPWAYTTYRGS